MKKWWIYIGKNNEGLIDCYYYRKKLDPIPDGYLFIGTAELEDEYFGKRIIDKFRVLFDEYAEKYHKDKVIKIFDLK